MLYLVSARTGALGLVGLVLEVRHYRQHPTAPSDEIAVELAARAA